MARTYTINAKIFKMNIEAEILKEKKYFFKVESARIQISSQKPREDKLNAHKKLIIFYILGQIVINI